MRPVEKGAAPGAFADYRDAAPYLQERLGDYCSYCERQIETHLAVEHIQPKSREPGLMTEWNNFLLACANCNSSKGDTALNVPDYVWPDHDNTMRAFDYRRGGVIQVQPGLPPVLTRKAQATIRLLGLDKDPGNPGREPTDSDRRWLRRQQAWEKAEYCRKLLASLNSEEVRALIVEVATGRGEFSIWWTAFEADADMRRRLREVFPGTAHTCFDGAELLAPRQGGQL